MRISFTEIRFTTLANLIYIRAKKCDRSRFDIKFIYSLRSMPEVMPPGRHMQTYKLINTIITGHYAVQSTH